MTSHDRALQARLELLSRRGDLRFEEKQRLDAGELVAVARVLAARKARTFWLVLIVLTPALSLALVSARFRLLLALSTVLPYVAYQYLTTKRLPAALDGLPDASELPAPRAIALTDDDRALVGGPLGFCASYTDKQFLKAGEIDLLLLALRRRLLLGTMMVVPLLLWRFGSNPFALVAWVGIAAFLFEAWRRYGALQARVEVSPEARDGSGTGPRSGVETSPATWNDRGSGMFREQA